MSRLWRWLREKVGEAFRPCGTPWAEDAVEGCAKGTVPVGPRNTYSNLAYAVAGLALWLRFGTPESIVMAGTLGFLCIGSMAYHAVPSRVTAALDHAGMYATFLALTTYAAGGTWIPMLAAALVGTIAFRLVWRADLNAMMGLFLWFAWVPAWATGSRALVVASAVGFALALAAWICDKKRVLTGKYGHACWHVLTAAAIGLVYAAQGR